MFRIITRFVVTILATNSRTLACSVTAKPKSSGQRRSFDTNTHKLGSIQIHHIIVNFIPFPIRHSPIENNMKVFKSNRSSPLIKKMKAFSTFLQNEKRHLKRQSVRTTKSIRYITGNRVEILLQSVSFQNLLKKCFGENQEKHFTAEDVQDYIKSVVREDPLYGEDMDFDNFAIIVSYGPVPMQIPHIDTTGRNFQFLISLTDDQPQTVGFQLQEDFPTVGHILVELHDMWQKEFKGCPNLLHELRTDPFVQETLSLYGSLLLPFEHMEDHEESLQFGQIVGMPGSIIHASPKVPKGSVRVVLFCSALPRDSHGKAYFNNSQMSRPILWCEICERIWDNLQKKERLVVLKMLNKFVLERVSIPVQDLIQEPKWKHLVQHMRMFVDDHGKALTLMRLFAADDDEAIEQMFPHTETKAGKRKTTTVNKSHKKLARRKPSHNSDEEYEEE